MVNLEPILFVFINQNMIQPKLKLLNCDLQNIEMCIAIKVILINKVVLGEQKKKGDGICPFFRYGTSCRRQNMGTNITRSGRDILNYPVLIMSY